MDFIFDEVKELLKNGMDKWKDEDLNVYGVGVVNVENFVFG